MATRGAACHCGQLQLEVDGRPVRRLDLPLPRLPAADGQRLRDAGGVPAGQVKVDGRFSDYSRISDEADRREHVFHFCPECGSQVFYTEPDEPDLVVVSVGAFADPSLPAADRVGLRPSPAPVGRAAGFGPGRPGRRGLGTRAAALRGGPLRRGGRPRASRCSSRSRIRGSSSTSPAARASPAGRPTPSTTCARRSTCGRAAARWRSTTPTSTPSATSPPSRSSSAKRPRLPSQSSVAGAAPTRVGAAPCQCLASGLKNTRSPSGRRVRSGSSS